MNRILLSAAIILGVVVGAASAQQRIHSVSRSSATLATQPPAGAAKNPLQTTRPLGATERANSSRSVYEKLHSTPMSPLAGLPGNIGALPITGSFSAQSDGRPLHNIQIDPDNPKNIHVIVTSCIDPSAADTASLSTRRIFYTFSSDGGTNWTAPKMFSTERTGFGDLQLFKRNGKYVPIIAAHRITAKAATTTISGIWIEKGNPGDGNFSESLANRTAGDNTQQDIIWPTLAVNPTGDTVYILGSINPSGSYLQFGTFVLNATKDSATFKGWKTLGDDKFDPNNPSTGLTGPGGATRIRISSSGRIGVLWVNDDNATPDNGMYYMESLDGGSTWSTPAPIWDSKSQNPDGNLNGAQLAPAWENVDFWFDDETPKFFFSIAATELGQNRYYPYTTSLEFFNPSVSSSAVNVLSRYFITRQDSNIDVLPIPAGSSISIQTPIFSFATVARTSDTNRFAVFYQTYTNGDTEAVRVDTGIAQYAYASIYYMETTDAGQTWSLSKKFMSTMGQTPKHDFREPMTSDFNPIVGGVPEYHVIAEIDTSAGYLEQNGLPGFDLMSYGHDVAIPGFQAVGRTAQRLSLSLGENYPNPFYPRTTISYSLENAGDVSLIVTDALGRPVAILANGRQGAGEHTTVFDGSQLPAGVYRCTLRSGTESATRNMSLLK